MLRSPRYEGIQALRFVAALLVVVTHSTFYAHERLDPTTYVWKGGTVGVDIFFVISGFVMMITARPFQVPGGWRNFGVRRLIRIVPMYWLATTLKLLTMLALPGAVLHASLTPWSALGSYFFLPTRNAEGKVEPLLGVGWTLTFEMTFYAVFAVALLVRRNVLALSSAVMICLGSLHAVRGDGVWPTWAVYFDQIVLYFVVGMVTARLAMSRRPRRNLLVALAVVIAVGLLFAFVPGIDWTRNALFRKAVVAAIFIVVVLAEPLLARVLPRTVLLFGDASYSLYLFHPMLAPIVPVALGVIGLRSQVLSITGSVAGSILAAVLIYWFVERRVMARLRALPYAGVPRGPQTPIRQPPGHRSAADPEPSRSTSEV